MRESPVVLFAVSLFRRAVQETQQAYVHNNLGLARRRQLKYLAVLHQAYRKAPEDSKTLSRTGEERNYWDVPYECCTEGQRLRIFEYKVMVGCVENDDLVKGIAQAGNRG